MANQYTNSAQQRLREWLQRNPEGWLVYTPDEIAEQIGVSRSSVYNWIDSLLMEIYDVGNIDGVSGQTFRRIHWLQSTITDHDRKHIARLLKEGCEIHDIAARFGLHPWNVQFIESSLKEEN